MFWNSNWYFESKAKMKTDRASSEKDIWLPAQEAEKVARLFTSSFPSFTKVMKRFNISGSYTLVSRSSVFFKLTFLEMSCCNYKILQQS